MSWSHCPDCGLVSTNRGFAQFLRGPVCLRRPVTGVSCEQYCGGGSASSCGGFLAVARRCAEERAEADAVAMEG
eukprot:495359-Alexandrium_andersonii.AAC.1